MKYSHEVMEFMGHHPGRWFRMRQIVRYVTATNRQIISKKATTKGVERVLAVLAESGVVRIQKSNTKSKYLIYMWK